MDETMRPIGSLFHHILSHNSQESQYSVEMPTEDEFEQLRAKRYNETAGDMNSIDGFSCSKCRNKGFIAFANSGETMKFRECKCMATRKSIRILRQSGLDHLIKSCRFDTYQQRWDWQTEAFRQATEYAQHPEGWFVCSGRSGTGKTHLCTAICRELMLKGMATRYMMWRDVTGSIKFAEPEDKQEILWRLKSIRVLYIDDFLKVGKREQPTTADVNIAFEILNHRYNDPSLITVISTELTASEIIQIDEAVGSRIYERSKQGHFLQFSETAQNWRLAQ